MSHEWSLLDAVQRLPRGPFSPLRFRLLTYDGILLPDHTLAYRGPEEVATAAGRIRVHGYQHLGAGMLPWVYYTSDSGRLLLAASGLQCWIYEEGAA